MWVKWMSPDTIWWPFLWPLHAEAGLLHHLHLRKNSDPSPSTSDCKGSFATQDQEFFLFPSPPRSTQLSGCYLHPSTANFPSQTLGIFLVCKPSPFPLYYPSQAAHHSYLFRERLPQAVPHLHASGVLAPWLPYVVLQIDTESLFGGSSRGMLLPLYSWLKNGAHDFRRDIHGAVREEGDTHVSSQISQINPGDQWMTGVAVRLLHSLVCL